MERQRSGVGQRVEGSLLATAVSFTNATLIEQSVAQVNRVPTGNRGQTAAPVDVYNMADNLHMHDLKHPMVGDRRSGEDRRRTAGAKRSPERRQGERRNPGGEGEQP